jgi:hypothetical protein
MFEMSIDENWSGPEASPWTTTAPVDEDLRYGRATGPAGGDRDGEDAVRSGRDGEVQRRGLGDVLVPSPTEDRRRRAAATLAVIMPVWSSIMGRS